MSVATRIKIEKKIVGAFVDAALKAGFRLSVSLERGFDVDEMLLGSNVRKRIMEEAFAGDQCHIFVHNAEEPLTKEGWLLSLGWVHCVFGNDGWDVIADYTLSLERFNLFEEANRLSDHYSGQ